MNNNESPTLALSPHEIIMTHFTDILAIVLKIFLKYFPTFRNDQKRAVDWVKGEENVQKVTFKL